MNTQQTKKKIIQLFRNIQRWLNRIANILFAILSFLFFLPFFINKEKVSESRALYIFFPNTFVWLSMYLFFLHVALLTFGYTDMVVFRWLAPFSNDPSAHFGTFFFVFFFPLMMFYLYINQVEEWNKRKMLEHFAEHISTKKEIRHALVEKYERREKQKRLFGLFRKRFFWLFVFLFGILALANIGAEFTAPWTEILIISISFSAMLALPLAFLKEQKSKL